MRVKTNAPARLKAALAALRGDIAVADAGEPWRLLADNAADLITRHAPDGRIRFASAGAMGLLGRSPGALEGLTPAALVHGDDLAAVQAVFRDASYFGREGRVAARLRHARGHYLWAELRCRRSDLASGGDIVAVTRDIGAWKDESAALVEARDDALAATLAKSRFLANMSHELRTPLNAIIGFSEVMAREMFGPLTPRYQDYAALIQESGNHLLELINGLLDMSKIEAGKFEIHEDLFDLAETAQGAARFVTLAAERVGVTLAVEVAAPARLAFADRRAVKQILVNLLANGVKFTPPGGRVVLRAAVQGTVLLLSVADTGTGIAPADLERLGKPFEQAAASGKEGTGLGLALVKALAALHGGEASLASAVGEGTTVTVRLPHGAVMMDGARQRPEAKVLPFRGAA